MISYHRHFTFSSKANGFDFFIVGEWENEEPIADDDYIDGFYEEMKLKYDYVFCNNWKCLLRHNSAL